MMGSFAMSGSLIRMFMNRFIVAAPSIMASSMQMSITCAPPSTWSRATSSAAEKLPSRISLANFIDPATFVRSPILMKFVSGRITSGSRPASAVICLFSGTALGLCPAAREAMILIWSGVVPQQPPMMLTQPFCRKFLIMFPI